MPNRRGQMIEKSYTVSEANEIIKCLLEREPLLRYIQICGEISNFKIYSSGHAYFTLKDKNSILKSVAFRSKMQFVKFKPENGMQVVALGSIGTYERDGIYQLYVERLLPYGQGALEQLLATIKAKLEKEGLFDPKHKQKLPLLPKAVGIITSAHGAAIHDIIKVSKQRYPGVKLYVVPVSVQGAESESEIVAALKLLNASNLVDVIILGRGGGSKEDLWVFNSEAIVREVFACQTPVISAVGHENDYTLTDYAADIRAATPSQAAELAVPDINALIENINYLQKTAVRELNSLIKTASLRLEHLRNNYVLRAPQQALLQRHSERLNSLFLRLLSADPVKFINKGFASIQKDSLRITSIIKIKPNDVLDLIMSDGVAKVQVLEVKNGDTTH